MNPFKKSENTPFYEGSFSWHWFNKWRHEIEIGSKWYIIEQKINELLKNKLNI